MDMEDESIPILNGKAKTLTEIAAYYRVSNKTMGKRIKIAGIELHKKERKRFYYPREISMIIEELGKY